MSVAGSIELQMISKILTSQDAAQVEILCGFGPEYYDILQPHIKFILQHKETYGNVPDVFTFQAEFNDINLVAVSEDTEYLCQGIIKNRERILLLQTFNKVKMLGVDDATAAWEYIHQQYLEFEGLGTNLPEDIVHNAKERSRKIVEMSKQARIPTGFDEIDEVMYGGLSTVEELFIIIARTNSGKSWVGAQMAEAAQKHGFNVLYYSPEMQSAYLATRFDTWRGHFENSKLYCGDYDENYYKYLEDLESQDSAIYVLEDKDAPGGVVDVPYLDKLVSKLHIGEVIIDGISYVQDAKKATYTHDQFKNIAGDLFQMSKKRHCAVCVMMQANRETQNCKDEKGEIFPTIFQAEGSDQPARIATTVFTMRQIFDRHVLDLRLEKARSAKNQKQTFSYAWDINTGTKDYMPGDSADGSIAPQGVAPASPNVHVDLPNISVPTLSPFAVPEVSSVVDSEEDVDFD